MSHLTSSGCRGAFLPTGEAQVGQCPEKRSARAWSLACAPQWFLREPHVCVTSDSPLGCPSCSRRESRPVTVVLLGQDQGSSRGGWSSCFGEASQGNELIMGWPVGSLGCCLTDSLGNEPISSSLHQLFRTRFQVMGIWGVPARSRLSLSQGVWGRRPHAEWRPPWSGAEAPEPALSEPHFPERRCSLSL